MTVATKILIVENDRLVARDIRQQLMRIGHNVLNVTGSGEEALVIAHRERPDLVLMDIRLDGEVDGVVAAQQVRDQLGIPVVFLTAHADDETIRRATRADPFGYLLKPFEDSQLRTVIEIALYKHRADRRLFDSERRYAVTLASIGEGVIATDSASRITFMNAIAEELTGWKQSEGLGQPLSEVFRTVDEDSGELIDNSASNAAPPDSVVGQLKNTILLPRDGKARPISDCGSPIVDDRGETTGVVIVFRDMTVRHQLEGALRSSMAELARANRLTALGELSISIAHEVNQPLMAIVTNAGTCLRWLASDQPNVQEARAAVERIVRDGHRAGDVVASIRALAGKREAAMEVVDLRRIIEEVIALMRDDFRNNNIKVTTDLQSDARPILGDRVLLQQVMLNLITNAAEAMSNVDHSMRTLLISSRESPNLQVLTSVTDSGQGLPSIDFGRVFESFFTTKAAGIGVGLSICKSIVDLHNGIIWSEPSEPSGSRFLFSIPIASQEAKVGKGGDFPTPHGCG